MLKPFEFTADGRSFSCTVETRSGPEAESWWWFAVSGDGQRYAPFRAARSDTRESVQERVAKFYADRLFARSQPTLRGSQWGKRAAQPEAPKAPNPPA